MQITVYTGSTEKTYEAAGERNVLSFLQKHGYYIDADCGGHGFCMKCMTSIDGRMKPACLTPLKDSMIIRLPETKKQEEKKEKNISAAVDLGTTTIHVSLFNESMEKIREISFMNPLRSFGADVITRIEQIQHDPSLLEHMSRMITEKLISECAPYGILKKAIISGNTVMQHILACIDPSSIASYPFHAKTLFREGKEQIPSLENCEVSFMPCTASYIGGDIVSGLLACDLYRRKDTCLFMDIGTNGELVLLKNGIMHACSAPAGPAFEGGEISCGSSDPSHAVTHFSYCNGELSLTCACEEPSGICGSGIIDLLACLLDMELVDETGRFTEPDEVPEKFSRYIRTDQEGNPVFTLNEKISFTGKDLRMLQMAGSALAAGISVLLTETDTKPEEIDHVLLSGNFGSGIRIPSCIRTGMIPSAFLSRTAVSGNTSLKGAEMVLQNPSLLSICRRIAEKTHYIELSDSAVFKAQYMEFMYITEERQWNYISRSF